ncbi:DNA-binding response regulator, OmpR family, contains REC and winged-helix (wHTH) domain [Geosporobacter subterraneus DSM 17957]|uniref:Stage 0 sporulation protein A homolog n=1 Tax=Geosporobacter subterraneus DSM 17957 TaxID=1121919 RepID=A0A1M6GLV0_9FIRM|nr:response regulator transcription factor [Geosporobacter subterraneus]SHJ10929.1 DNA-binding response regulator, OmpR family, contains REC and winged-helix (wHTH) domain [Geosporobacter subterraneus DSM 17957]
MEQGKILVAEDDREIRMLLKKYLEKEGYKVDTACDGVEALASFERYPYHLVLLDVMMPKMDGIEVCRRLRNQSNIPILMLTAKDGEVDMILGLGMGADDYITKPFRINEVLARVKAQLRRYFLLGTKQDENQLKVFGNLTIDMASYSVQRGQESIVLTAKEFQLLKFFSDHPNQVFTKAQIFRQVWGDEYIEDDNTVMVHIRRLRKKIEENPEAPEYIQTVWGIGYKFVGDGNR